MSTVTELSESLQDQVLGTLSTAQGLAGTDASSVGPETALQSIGFDSLACAEFSAVVEEGLRK